jgi:tetratricopeptide (TPR) repeat protein
VGENVSERLRAAREEAERLGLHEEVARCAASLAARAAFAGAFEDAEREARRLLELALAHDLKSAAVDGYQALAVVRQTQGALIAALDARRNAVAAARAAGLKEREAMLTTNLGFALTTLGARQEARAQIEAGLALAEAIGSVGAVRHAQMNLLGWAAAFGNDKRLEAHLGEVRADADAAAAEIWTAPDRANLGTLFYRGVELLRSKDARASARAVALLRAAATGYRQMGHQDVLPVALGMWAEAERQCGRFNAALALVQNAAELLAEGAPSLLNESNVYLTWHDLLLDRGDLEGARGAVERGLAPLLVRLRGLSGTPYARQFLTEVPSNAGLIAAAHRFGLVPEDAQALLAVDAP